MSIRIDPLKVGETPIEMINHALMDPNGSVYVSWLSHIIINE